MNKEDIDLIIQHTGHVRFRALLDPGHPDYSPGYLELAESMLEFFKQGKTYRDWLNRERKPSEIVQPKTGTGRPCGGCGGRLTREKRAEKIEASKAARRARG